MTPDRLDIESLALVHATAARRRLIETPFPQSMMPVYVDLYLAGAPVASCAVLPDDRAIDLLHDLTRLLDADTIVHTCDAYLAAASSPTSAASVQSRFEVGDPSVCEGIAVMIVSLEEGALSVRLPYARSVVDGVEFHDAAVSGLEDDDRIDEALASRLLAMLDDSDLGVAPLPTFDGDELAILLHDPDERSACDGWGLTSGGVSNVPDGHPLLALLGAARSSIRSRG